MRVLPIAWSGSYPEHRLCRLLTVAWNVDFATVSPQVAFWKRGFGSELEYSLLLVYKSLPRAVTRAFNDYCIHLLL